MKKKTTTTINQMSKFTFCMLHVFTLCFFNAGAQSTQRVYIQDFSNKSVYPSLSASNYPAILNPGSTQYFPKAPTEAAPQTYYNICPRYNFSAGSFGMDSYDHTDPGNGFLMYIDANYTKTGESTGSYFILPLSTLNVPGATYRVKFYIKNMDQASYAGSWIPAYVGLAVRNGIGTTYQIYNSSGSPFLTTTPINGDNVWHEYSLDLITIPTSFSGSTLYFNFFNTQTNPTGNGNDLAMDDIIVDMYTINTLSGTVYTNDSVANGTSTTLYNEASNSLYALLVDNNNKVVQAQLVNNANGSFSFNSSSTGYVIPYSTSDIGLKVVMYGSNPGVGSTLTSSQLSGGLVNTISNNNGTQATTAGYLPVVTNNTDVAGLTFYVQHRPVADAITNALAAQPLPNSSMQVNLTGSDVEDFTAGGSLGTGGNKTVVINTLPTNGTLIYNGINVSAGQVIPAYSSAGLVFRFTGAGYTSSSFTYSYVDNAGAASVPATYTVKFSYLLPVQYTTPLSAIKKGTSVSLSWTTGTENNNREFLVEKSSNGTDWTTIGSVPTYFTNGNGDGHSYSYTDVNPLTTTTYYQLLQTDRDGKSTKSNVASFSSLGNNIISLYPNPVSNSLNVTGLIPGTQLRILGTDKKTLITMTVSNTMETVNVSRLPAGTYFLQIVNKTLNTTQDLKFVK